MFNKFEEDARKVLVEAKEEMFLLKHPYVGSEHLMLAILKDKRMAHMLENYGVTYEKFREKLVSIIGMGSNPSEWFLHTPLLKRIIENATLTAKENNNGDVSIEHLLIAMLDEGEGVAIRIMISMNVMLENLYRDLSKRNVVKKSKKKNMIIEEIAVDFNKKALNNEFDPVIGRDEEINRVIEILGRRTKNNPLLIGEAGVGKTAIIEGISELIAKGMVPKFLKNKRILSVDMASTVAGTKYRGEFEERIKKMLLEVEESEDIILFIDEIHTLVGAGGAEGAIDASNIFKPALARGKIKCIGATTTAEYKKYIEHDGALDRRFQKIFIEVPSNEKVKEIIMGLKPIYEAFHNVVIEEDIINLIISLSDKYIHERYQPDKTIDILDEVCAKVSIRDTNELKMINHLNGKLDELAKEKNDLIIKNDFEKAYLIREQEEEIMQSIAKYNENQMMKKINRNDVAEVVYQKTKIPVTEILGANAENISSFEEYLRGKIFGQEQAISTIINLYKRIKMGFKVDNKCLAYLFKGPSGTGKTMLAKEFGNALVGKDNVIKLDMSDYSEAHSISKIIGSPPGYIGYDDNNNILEDIRNKPYSVLILDEVEKAHPSILNIFLGILDDSVIKNAYGKEIRFDNVIIIMTTNAGSSLVNVGFDKDLNVSPKFKAEFKQELINRISEIISFNKLSKKDMLNVIKNKINELIDKFDNAFIYYNENIIDEIFELSNFEESGARKIDKIIREKIEPIIFDGLINEKQEIFIDSIKEIIK